MSTVQEIKNTKPKRLQTVASKNMSYSGALRSLGIENTNGRNIETLRKMFKVHKVSTGHFC